MYMDRSQGTVSISGHNLDLIVLQNTETPPEVVNRRELWFHVMLFIAVVLVTIVCNILNSFFEGGLGVGLYRSLGRMIRRWVYDPRQAHDIPVYLDIHMT